MFNNIQIYVLHHKLLKDRKKYFLEQLSYYNLTGKWIEEFLPDNISVPENNPILKTEYSLYLKHQNALNDQIQNSYNFSLIFEDDALLCNNFLVYFNTVFNEFIDLNCDILMLGTAIFPGLNLTPKNMISNKHVYYDPSYTTRCTHAILYTLNAAKQVVEEMKKTPMAYDHKLNEIITIKNLKTCWVEPGLLQGSRPDTPTTHLWHTSLR